MELFVKIVMTKKLRQPTAVVIELFKLINDHILNFTVHKLHNLVFRVY